MHAAEKGHATCVGLLAEREEGMQESDGKTALMSAARNGLQKQWTSLRRGRGTRRLLADGLNFRLAQQPLTSQGGWAALQSPPSSVDSMLIPSCAIPQRILTN